MTHTKPPTKEELEAMEHVESGLISTFRAARLLKRAPNNVAVRLWNIHVWQLGQAREKAVRARARKALS